MSDIKGLLIRILRDEFDNKYAIVGKVVSVDGNNIIIDNLETGARYSNIRLQANPGNGVLIIPKEDSFVIVGRLTGNAGYVAMVSDADSIQLLDGSYGGLIKIDELVAKLNALETYTRDLKTSLDTHTHLGVTTGGGTSGVPPVPSVTGIPNTVNADLENEDIVHGIP